MCYVVHVIMILSRNYVLWSIQIYNLKAYDKYDYVIMKCICQAKRQVKYPVYTFWLY